MSQLLEAALRYAGLGWPVFPAWGKVPKNIPEFGFTRGSLTATTDTHKIAECWTKYPAHNIAIATNHAFWVLDVDTKNGGPDSLEQLEAKHGKLPDTIRQITGRDGTHYFFRPIDGITVHNSENKIAPGIDIRGESGYIVAAPSVHPDTGKRYEFDGLEEIEKQKILDAPDWLIKLMFDGDSSHNGYKPEFAMPQKRMVEGSGRNSLLFRMGCSGRGKGYSAETVETSIRTENKSFEQPLDDRELEQVLHSVARYPIRQLNTYEGRMNAEREYQKAQRESQREEQRNALVLANSQGIAIPWRDRCTTSLNGRFKDQFQNAYFALGRSDEFFKAFAYDEFNGHITVKRDICDGMIKQGTRITDYEVGHILLYCQQGFDADFKESTVQRAIDVVARENTFHPVRDYLTSLTWDGTERLAYWTADHLGAERSRINMEFSRRWLISAVARIMQPGCKADCCLVLYGAQGIGKSSAFSILGGDWFNDSIGEISSSNKDAFHALQGSWLLEFGEMDSLSRAEHGAVKKFISARQDKFRLPYARRDDIFPRQCVFGGTCNHPEFLSDTTGGRRYWPIECRERLNHDAFAAVRDQLWAEALVAYRSGDAWHLDDEELVALAQQSQEERTVNDPWEEFVCKLLDDQDRITMSELMTSMVGSDRSKWNARDQSRISQIIQKIGFRRVKEWDKNAKRQHWIYVKQ